VGAGAGATVGKLFGPERAMKGGIGSASLRVGAVTVGALVAVNAVGDVVHPASGAVLAGARDDAGGFIGTAAALCQGRAPAALLQGMNTTIGVVATDAVLDKAGCQRLAAMAHDGLAHCIRPAHTPLDGDTLFALATGGAGVAGSLTVLGALTAEVVARAVLNAVWFAHGLPGLPAMNRAA
jgi:L-aminopeptidase/D-esterase-like protein